MCCASWVGGWRLETCMGEESGGQQCLSLAGTLDTVELLTASSTGTTCSLLRGRHERPCCGAMSRLHVRMDSRHACWGTGLGQGCRLYPGASGTLVTDTSSLLLQAKQQAKHLNAPRQGAGRG